MCGFIYQGENCFQKNRWYGTGTWYLVPYGKGLSGFVPNFHRTMTGIGSMYGTILCLKEMNLFRDVDSCGDIGLAELRLAFVYCP